MKTLRARTWKFGDDINTDLMLPGDVLLGTEEEQRRAVFRANRPNWIHEVRPGDIVIGGRNYGMGSGRPAGRSLKNAGAGALIAESLNGLFFRGSVNSGFIALECPGVHAAFEEMQVAEISLDDFTVRNVDTGQVLQITPVPEMLLDLMLNGGLMPRLEQQGYIRIRKPAIAVRTE